MPNQPMSIDDSIDADALRPWLEYVQTPATTRDLMIAIAVDEGIAVSDLADWYDISTETIEDWLHVPATEPIVVSIAEREGVDFDELAQAADLGRETVLDWFRALDDRPIAAAANIVARYSRRSSGPILTGTESRIQYLNYDAVMAHEWSIDDEDLFEKASNADLDTEDYGRFMVDAGETILEAAESRNISWPYACRGGACANCAVIVKEGDVAMPGQTVLSEDQVQATNARLTCVGVPVTDELKLVMNVQQLDEFEELRLPSPVAESEPSI